MPSTPPITNNTRSCSLQQTVLHKHPVASLRPNLRYLPTNMETINIVRNSSQLPHPFYPLEANIVGYLANKWSVPTLLGIFAAGWVVILGATIALVRRHNPTLPAREKATILWFVLSE